MQRKSSITCLDPSKESGVPSSFIVTEIASESRKSIRAGRDCHQDPQTRSVIYSRAMGDWQYRACFTTSKVGTFKSKANAVNEVQRVCQCFPSGS